MLGRISWRKLKQKLKGERGDDASSISSRGSSIYSTLGFRPNQPHYPPQGSGAYVGYPPNTFKSQVRQAALETMSVAVEVWRQGNLLKEENPSVAASRLLLPGKERDTHLAQSYSLATFIEIFERKINSNAPDHPVEISYGRLGYFTSNGEHKVVRNQDDFEVAINHLYLNRSGSDVLRFLFQPEPQDAAIDRQAAIVAEASSAARPTNFRPTDSRPSEGSLRSIDKEIGSTNPPYQLSQTTRFDRAVLPGGDPFRLLTPDPTPRKNDGRAYSLEGFRSPPERRPVTPVRPLTGISSQSKTKERPKSDGEVTTPYSGSVRKGLHKVGDIFGRRPTSPALSDGEQNHHEAAAAASRASSRDLTFIDKKRSGKGVHPKVPEKPARKPETKEEIATKFPTLWKEIGRSSFKSGGKDEEVSNEKTPRVEKEEHEEEAEFPEEENEEDDIPQEDRVATMLQSLQNLEALTQLDDPADTNGSLVRWQQCCRMFGRNPAETQVDQLVAISGLKTEIYQYQAFGVYWQMVTSRQLGGGFVADDMGLGKTLSFLAYIVVERQLSVLWREVRKSRAEKDGRHLLVEQHGDDDRCPSPHQRGWIACPCASSSPTSLMEAQPGVRMACVPPALVGTWWLQWKTHVDTSDTVLGMTILVDHPGAFGPETMQADFLAKSDQARNLSRLKAETYGRQPTQRKDGRGDDTPKGYQEGYLLLTTKESYPKYERHFHSKGLVHDPRNPGGWKDGIRTSLIFGIAMIDESHEDCFKNKGRAQVLTELPTANNCVRPFLWGYSGTPFSQSPRGLEGVLWAIEQHVPKTQPPLTGWQSDPKLKQFEWQKLDNICKRYDHQLKSKKRDDAAVEQILDEFKPFLLSFVIRRTADTEWFGHPLVQLKPHIHQDVTLDTLGIDRSEQISHFEKQFQSEKDDLLAGLQTKWDNFPDARRSNIRPTKLAFNTFCRCSWRSRVLSTIPWAVKLAVREAEPEAKGDLHDDSKANARMNLTEEETISLRGSDAKEKASQYRRYIRNITESSPKFLWVYDFVTQLEAQKDINGNEQKLVILTQFPQVAFALKMFFLKYFPEKAQRVGMIIGRMKLREKNAILEAFTDAVDQKGKRKSKDDYQFLIGTTRFLGTGLQLTRACNLVLMEPDNEFWRERQVYARVHRIGQRNPLSRSYRLISASSEIEQKILRRQQDRKEYPGLPIGEEEIAQIEGGPGLQLPETADLPDIKEDEAKEE